MSSYCEVDVALFCFTGRRRGTQERRLWWNLDKIKKHMVLMSKSATYMYSMSLAGTVYTADTWSYRVEVLLHVN